MIASNVVINSVSYVRVQWYSVIARLNISSECHVTTITLSGPGTNTASLIYGDALNGVYEYEVSPVIVYNDYTLAVDDACSKQYYFSSALLFNPIVGRGLLAKVPTETFDITNITYFKISSNQFDLSGGGDVNGTIYFNLTSHLRYLEPIFINSYFSLRYTGSYNSSLGLYVLPFTIPQGMIQGKMFYQLNFPIFSVDSPTLESYFGESIAAITIVNSASDFMPPILEEVHAIPGNSFIINNPGVEMIGWNIRITDFPNGFSYGSLNVITDLDVLPITINFNSSSLIFGDQFDGIYEIRFPVNGTCRTQAYSMTNVVLYDKQAYRNPALVSMNPLTSIYGTQLESQLKIQVSCPTIIVDNDPPIMTSFDFSPKIIDTGRQNRTVQFEMVISDIGPAGLSLRHTPIVILTSENSDTVQVSMERKRDTPTGTLFQGSIQLKYGFGINLLLVSVYGLVDNFKNYGAYHTYDLRNSSNAWPYYINISRSYDEPILEKSLKLSNQGGELIVFGKNFGLNSTGFSTKINYQDGKGYVNTGIDVHTGIMPIYANNITLIVTKNGIDSNELLIPVVYDGALPPKPTDTPNPTNTPNPTTTPSQKCPGTPTECNNNGRCINSTCQCFNPWYGPSCSSKTIITPIPPAYPDPLTGTNITESGSLITSSIEIVGVRELDATMNVVQSFNISKWNFTDLTTASTNPKYYYSTILEQRSTFLNVSIEYFKQSANITFADEQLDIPASSIKFSMNMSSYQFKEQTNLIQIMMRSSIQSNNSKVCSSTGVGVIDKSVQWIKLNIDQNSLYGRFLSKGVRDGRVSVIQNVIIEDNESEQTKQMRSVIVGITSTAFDHSLSLDPDFSNLIDVGSTDTSDFKCSSNKKLSNGAIAGIVVGGVVFLSIVIAAALLIKKKKKFKQQEMKMKNRLSDMNKGL
ncbi:hypothetical protein PPL_02618 [Heterostelium album PN500]|uniref:EGF-like domain-containing protein n=1 Tax=Heterostelium pallidum (strain ATCC 26659 / Pp 5 / PN500) TaxID=670386 RepID=D3B2K4_HETP5|nr:hypothetical protein PPL_02618 [Heterostelium album PN500]EFA83552.1 hypothetical protein PPL_02618 [Heterostelium album PN500]|eukprot:XP_020435669.1 hypothetical protein PPL_02618 [Heterostelium album PN500]